MQKQKRQRRADVLDGAREPLITLGIVVLESNLELNGLNEVALLITIGFTEQLLDGAPHA